MSKSMVSIRRNQNRGFGYTATHRERRIDRSEAIEVTAEGLSNRIEEQ